MLSVLKSAPMVDVDVAKMDLPVDLASEDSRGRLSVR
jgi:hypothetical protein